MFKTNQGQLHEAVVDYFKVAEATDFVGITVQHKQALGGGHLVDRMTYALVDMPSAAIRLR